MFFVHLSLSTRKSSFHSINYLNFAFTSRRPRVYPYSNHLVASTLHGGRRRRRRHTQQRKNHPACLGATIAPNNSQYHRCHRFSKHCHHRSWPPSARAPADLATFGTCHHRKHEQSCPPSNTIHHEPNPTTPITAIKNSTMTPPKLRYEVSRP